MLHDQQPAHPPTRHSGLWTHLLLCFHLFSEFVRNRIMDDRHHPGQNSYTCLLFSDEHALDLRADRGGKRHTAAQCLRNAEVKISKRTLATMPIKNGVFGGTSRLTAMQELNNVTSYLHSYSNSVFKKMRLLLHNIQYGTGRLKQFSWLATLHPTHKHLRHIERFVHAVNPDIVGLIEVDSGSYRNRSENQAEMLANKMNYTHTHRIKYPEASVGRRIPILNKQSNAVLTRDKILKERFHDFQSGFKSLVIEVELPALTLFIVHLSLGLRARHRQLEELHKLLGKCTKPRILAGDFNALSGRWELSMFLKATGMQSANRNHAPTYPSWRPYRELDFICHDDNIIPVRFRIPEVRVSDHRPLIFDFEINPATHCRNDATAACSR